MEILLFNLALVAGAVSVWKLGEFMIARIEQKGGR